MDELNDFRWLSGKPGESAFTKPFLSVDSLDEANAKHPEFYRRMESSGDDRSYVLVAAMVLESKCDDILRKMIPGFNRLRDNRDFGFSVKIELLRALRLIPPVIPRCADLVRQIRNEFAHNLVIDKLEDIKPQLLRQAEALYDEVNDAYKRTHLGQPARQVLHEVVGAAMHGLNAYAPNVAALRRAIDDPAFVEQLQRSVEIEFSLAIGAPQSKK